MKATDAGGMTIPQLVEQFRVLALAQSDANSGGQISKFTQLYWKLDAIRTELRSREGDQRRALIQLYDHPNPQVRLEAALATLAVCPEKARSALQLVVDRDEYPQAANARLALLDLEKGRSIPG